MINHRIEDRVWNNMNLAERREVYRQRGWQWNRSRRNRKNVIKRRNKKKGGLVRFLRSYIAYPYRTKTRTLGKGRMVTAITQLINGTFSEIYVLQLSTVAFSQEFTTIKENFSYYKILGIGITVMPQNLESNHNLYFMICWNGEPMDNFRINDSVCIVPPFLTRPKTYFFRLPKMDQFTGLPFFFRSVGDTGFLPILQMQAKDNTVNWHVRVDVVMEFRTLTSHNQQMKIIYENEEDKKKDEEERNKEKVKLEEIRKKLREERKKKNFNTMDLWKQIFEKDDETVKGFKPKNNNCNFANNLLDDPYESGSENNKNNDEIIKEMLEDNKKSEKSSFDCSFELQKEKNKLDILKQENDKIIKKIGELENKKENNKNEDKDKDHRRNLVSKYGKV